VPAASDRGGPAPRPGAPERGEAFA
jgi:hypothetical protein